MKNVYVEIKESMKKRKLFAILIFINTFIFFLLLTILYVYYFNVDTKTDSFYSQYEGKNIYQLSDNLLEEKEEQYFSSTKGLETVKNFHN